MENLGLERGYLELCDYREDYPSIYEKAKEELLDIYKDRIKYIDHVGSTSIKGIKSKPIIDINIQTDDLDDFKEYTESSVEGDIYTVKKEPTMGGDYLIRKEEDGKVKAFIHVYATGDMNCLTSNYNRKLSQMKREKDAKDKYDEDQLDLYNIQDAEDTRNRAYNFMKDTIEKMKETI